MVLDGRNCHKHHHCCDNHHHDRPEDHPDDHHYCLDDHLTNPQVEGQQEFIIEAADVSEMRCWLIAIQASIHHHRHNYNCHSEPDNENDDV